MNELIIAKCVITKSAISYGGLAGSAASRAHLGDPFSFFGVDK